MSVDQQSGLSAGVIVSIAVGVALLLIIAVLVVVVSFRSRRQNRADNVDDSNDQVSNATPSRNHYVNLPDKKKTGTPGSELVEQSAGTNYANAADVLATNKNTNYVSAFPTVS